jgi:hypothetical protein
MVAVQNLKGEIIQLIVELSPLLNCRQQWYSFMHICRLMYYNCVKFHKNSISSLVGVALTMYIPPFHESVSWIISPFKFWTATIFLHAHLQVVYYKCVKFHKNPISIEQNMLCNKGTWNNVFVHMYQSFIWCLSLRVKYIYTPRKQSLGGI